MNNMEKQKFEIVKKYIDEMDYMGLLSLGCPKNEYDGESEKIAIRIKPDMSPEEIALLINDVFTKSFYECIDVHNSSGLIEHKVEESNEYINYISPRVLKTAKELYNALQKFYSKFS